MFPWQDWHEWVSVFHLLFSDLSVMAACGSNEREIDLLIPSHSDASLKKALGILTLWTAKNVAGDQSKYLKMQKLLLVQTLSMRRMLMSEGEDYVASDDQIMALNFRLIHLVEMGAKTAEYKKSKQGGKLAMKNVADELGFPSFLV